MTPNDIYEALKELKLFSIYRFTCTIWDSEIRGRNTSFLYVPLGFKEHKILSGVTLVVVGFDLVGTPNLRINIGNFTHEAATASIVFDKDNQRHEGMILSIELIQEVT